MIEPSANPTVPRTDATKAKDGAQESQTNQDMVVFPIPSGFVPPEGVGPGESFDAVCRIQYRRGKLILEAVEGHEVHREQVPTPKMTPTTFESAVEAGVGSDEGMA